jgi:hypothetical protein
MLHVRNLLDVGSGDGRVFTPLGVGPDVSVIIKTGVEKAQVSADKLIADGVWLIGRDFYKMTLMGKSFDVAFTNPPYSAFKRWCSKFLSEVSAPLIYMVIPSRWKDDRMFVDKVKSRGEYTVLGEFDFLDGDRAARAAVDLVRIAADAEDDLFSDWVRENIGAFKSNSTARLEKKERRKKEKEQALTTDGKEPIQILLRNYNEDMQELLQTYTALAEMDFAILESIGVDYNVVLRRLKETIQSLKSRYWSETLDRVEAISSRLTHKTRQKLKEGLVGFSELDFNEDNIRNITIYVIENSNKYSEEQLLEVYDAFTSFGNFHAYKSNERWTKRRWRSEKLDAPVKYKLDYRIVLENPGIARSDDWEIGKSYLGDILDDIVIVLRSLGFTEAMEIPHVIERGKKYAVTQGDRTLLTVKVYKKRTAHFQFDQEVMRKFNIEVGKRRQWIKNYEDIMEEFDVPEEEALAYFKNPLIDIMDLSQGQLLLN